MFNRVLIRLHCVKSVQIRSSFWSVLSRIRFEYGKIRTRENYIFGHFLRSHSDNNQVHLCKYFNFTPIIFHTHIKKIGRRFIQSVTSSFPLNFQFPHSARRIMVIAVIYAPQINIKRLFVVAQKTWWPNSMKTQISKHATFLMVSSDTTNKVIFNGNIKAKILSDQYIRAVFRDVLRNQSNDEEFLRK